METVQPIAPLEQEPILEPSKPKARRNIFELFKRQEEANKTAEVTEKTKKTVEKPSGRSSEKSPPANERRRFAADIIMLIRSDEARQRMQPTLAEPEPKGERRTIELTQKLEPIEARPPVLELAALPLVERAKEMGRGVLRLISRVRSDVTAADRRERVTAPTDIQPLETADADVRAAMQELIAPIEEYQASHPVLSLETDTFETPKPEKDTVATAIEFGGGPDPQMLEQPKSIFARTVELAAAVAGVTSREALEVKERHTGRVRKVGLFALGASTVGGFAYTWRRMRKLKKEQREMKKEHRRFETEVREAQAQEERRLFDLEQTNVKGLTQPQRQQFVQEVSEFAHTQAAEIRTTAHATEVIYTPLNPGEQRALSVASKTSTETTVFTGRKLEKPEKPHGSVFDMPASTEHGGIIERLGNVVSGFKHTESETSATGSGGSFAAAGSPLAGASIGKPGDAPQMPPSPQPQPSLKKHTQAWLLGSGLAVALVLVVLFLMGVL
jgi:hypothetical protein